MRTYPEAIFLICPVRNVDEVELDRIRAYVANLEANGKYVYWPYRDTNQDQCGWWICVGNRASMERCSEVHIWWNATSAGSIFDLGMAMAFKKKLTIANPQDVHEPRPKSFENVIRLWEAANDLL